MNIEQKVECTFSDLIMAASEAWGVSRAGKMVCVLIKSNVVVFRAPLQFCFSSAQERYL